ncbi:MAG: hypothetical protein A2252_04880 [Elusimicrobia bacterium RIFOXYA2_FULL_39_19]|nr:MAG: hypothetical protein A2252_04880 [Elusimicrobia bacterium RIFOXYA2_FULL_39_19]
MVVYLFSISQLKAGEVENEKLVFCPGVENNEPVNHGESFASDTGKIYLWMNVTSGNVPAQVKHLWYYEGKKMSEVDLDIKYANTRTWNYKTIMPEWKGSWEVDVVDAEGKLIKKVDFKIEN